jgi:hypothetical protein
MDREWAVVQQNDDGKTSSMPRLGKLSGSNPDRKTFLTKIQNMGCLMEGAAGSIPVRKLLVFNMGHERGSGSLRAFL